MSYFDCDYYVMQPEESKTKLQVLVDQFKANIKQYKSPAYDEANTRVDFIDKFFELLDWDVRNEQGFSEDYREVVREAKIPPTPFIKGGWGDWKTKSARLQLLDRRIQEVLC